MKHTYNCTKTKKALGYGFTNMSYVLVVRKQNTSIRVNERTEHYRNNTHTFLHKTVSELNTRKNTTQEIANLQQRRKHDWYYVRQGRKQKTRLRKKIESEVFTIVEPLKFIDSNIHFLLINVFPYELTSLFLTYSTLFIIKPTS